MAQASGEETALELEDELMKLSRENIKICDEIIASVEGSSDGDVDSLLGHLRVLMALRASSEADGVSTPMSRVASSGKPSRNAKRGTKDNLSVMSTDDRDAVMADSPSVPSPKVPLPTATRLKVSAGGSRAGSVPAGREASVKIEDATDTDGNKCTLSLNILFCLDTIDSHMVSNIFGEQAQVHRRHRSSLPQEGPAKRQRHRRRWDPLRSYICDRRRQTAPL